MLLFHEKLVISVQLARKNVDLAKIDVQFSSRRTSMTEFNSKGLAFILR